MTDRLPVRKMNPVHGGTWAGIDVEKLLDRRATYSMLHGSFQNMKHAFDELESRRTGIDAASIRRLAGEGE